ncbi:MAG: FHA domain-containing protein [Acidimicrobiales bacterium]
MTDALLTLLRWCLLGLLYLFFLRVLQATWSGVQVTAGGGGRIAAAGDGRRSGRSGRRASRHQSVLLVLEPPELTGREFPVNGELTIGRAASCHISIDDSYMSQLHARVSPHPDGAVVEDLGSTNGTYLNRQRVTSPVVAVAGDRIQVGGIVMELR